jgi:RNA polymerase sigma-70 factor (ECF subfamily)
VGQGSGRSFEEFFAATYGRLVGLLFAFVHDRAQAEDAVQDAFASAWLRWPVLRRYHDPEAWVRMVAFRRAIDHQRRSVRQLRALLRLGPPRRCRRSGPSTST